MVHGHEFRYVSRDFPQPMSPLSQSTPSSEEQEQNRQTIEMFEVIIEANPQDTHSMEILKEAYMNSGDHPKAMSIGRRLAETYVEMGQYSSALLEYEGILQMDPDNPEIMVALGELSEKLQAMQDEERARQDAESGIQLNEVVS
jgi:cytochrome c-type biogenesis protein CcmH/NrfG